MIFFASMVSHVEGKNLTHETNPFRRPGAGKVVLITDIIKGILPCV